MRYHQSRLGATQLQSVTEKSARPATWEASSPTAALHAALQADVDQSPRMLAQRQAIETAFGSAIQRQLHPVQEEPDPSHTDHVAANGPGVVQRIALYHGTTIEAAGKVLDGVDPSKGGGEFGQGFYTVFAPEQAKHIAMYYWDKEKKYNKGATGIAVVKMSIPDNWWAALMSTGDEDYKVTHSENGRDWSMLKYQADPRENNDAEDGPEFDGSEREATEGKPWFLPRNADEDVDYQEEEDRKSDLEHDIIVGPIKDKQTPYLQVVFGAQSADYLLAQDEVKRSISFQQTQGKTAFGTGVYDPIKALASEETGSLVETTTVQIKRFREGLAAATDRSKRLNLLTNVFGGMQDKNIPDEMVAVFKELKVDGENKGTLAFNYYNDGGGV